MKDKRDRTGRRKRKITRRTREPELEGERKESHEGPERQNWEEEDKNHMKDKRDRTGRRKTRIIQRTRETELTEVDRKGSRQRS